MNVKRFLIALLVLVCLAMTAFAANAEGDPDPVPWRMVDITIDPDPVPWRAETVEIDMFCIAGDHIVQWTAVYNWDGGDSFELIELPMTKVNLFEQHLYERAYEDMWDGTYPDDFQKCPDR